MTARPTDEEIRAMAARLRNAPNTLCSVFAERDAANLLDAILAERQAARDGVTEKMVDSAMLAWSGYYCDCNDANVAGNNRDAMQAALQSVAQPVRVPEEKEDLDPVKLHRQGRFATEFERGFNEGWNACREAMLSTSSQPQQPVQDGWVKHLSAPITTEELKRAWNMIGQAHPQKEWVERALTDFIEKRLCAAPAYNGKKEE